MRKFESLVMAETEPVTSGTLWLKTKPNTTNGEDGGLSVWYFGENGWTPLFDSDTRYNTTYSFEKTASEVSVTSIPNVQHKDGITNVSNTMYIYDGSRELGNNYNLVTEAGLNVHVTSLQEQINNLSNSLTDLAGVTERLGQRIDTIESNLND